MSQQKSLFETDIPPWEQDAAHQQYVATIVFPQGAPGEFDYAVEDRFSDNNQPEQLLEPGRRVRAPLGRGNRQVVGYCVAAGVKTVDPKRLKAISGVLDAQRLLSPAMLRLTKWMADYYLCSWGQVLETVVPSGVRGRAGTREVVLLSLSTTVAAQWTRLKLPDKQRRVLEVLSANPKPLTVKQLQAQAECTTAPINTLRKKQLIESHTERLDLSEIEAQSVERELPKELNADQQQALQAIHQALDAGEHRNLLLHGITGSGKTEVYIQAIEKVVSFGRQAIVLVPEISLTPQTVGRFRARFDRIAVLHSHQTDVERHRHWKRIATGEVQVIVGARSAVFAPTKHLGLIVIDEEHETSFKQDSAPRYHARDVARHRTQDEGVPLILGSATPSLESWLRASTGESQRLSMPRRIGDRPLPRVRVIDLKQEMDRPVRGTRRGAISRSLYQAMEVSLQEQGQIILLLNRRGFSTHVQCPACGGALKCPECEVSMTFHLKEQCVICHWCDRRQAAPKVCPDCKSPAIRYGGLGTQKLEAEVNARFPKHKCLRMDTDSMRKPGSHEQALDAFRAGEIDILLGTQMIAKGLDFPNVTLVGVISADGALHFPDFRSAERTFHLVTQVAGRTGRGEKGGRVLVQTLEPDHPAIVAASTHNYLAFAEEELPTREALGYPPYGSMVRFIFRGPSEVAVQAFAEQVSGFLKPLVEATEGGRLRGPAPATLAKLRGDYRFHLQAQSLEGNSLRSAAAQALKKMKPPEGVLWALDVDPIDMM